MILNLEAAWQEGAKEIEKVVKISIANAESNHMGDISNADHTVYRPKVNSNFKYKKNISKINILI